MASVKWSQEALQNLEELDAVVRARILQKITWFEENFDEIVPEPLHRTLKGFFKIRIGDYRVVYTINPTTIVIEAVGHRRDIYR